MKNVGDTIKHNDSGALFKVISERNGHKLLMSEELEVSREKRSVVSMHHVATDEPFLAESEWMMISDFIYGANFGVDDGTILKLLNVMRAMVMR